MKVLRFLAFLVPLVLAAVVVEALASQVTTTFRLFDPFLLVTVWFGAHGRRLEGMFAGALAGLVQDAALSQQLGTHYVAKVVVGYLTTLFAGRLIPGQPTTHAVLIATASVVQAVVQVALGFLLGQEHSPGSFGSLVAQVIGNVVAGTALFGLVGHIGARRARGMAHGPRGR